MSGIAGIFALDGGIPDASQIEALIARLERRGPDGTHVHIDGPVALGHALLATTPEALVERLPFTDWASGCTITADVRLDNRDELMDALGLNDARTIGDGELVLRAYLEWGDDCAARLLGDFAFAIWDPRARRLLCARDQIGMRQFTYHHDPGRRFVFATEPNALLALPGLDAPLNPDRLADYFGNMEGADLTSTFFRGILRLPPAHILTLDRDGLALRRYWDLTPEPTLELPSDEAYADAFRAVFTQAVRSRLRSAKPVGSMVSGGIDSNAVAAVAANLLASTSHGPLATFSATGPNPAICPETRAIQSALKAGNFAPNVVDHAALGPLHADLARGTAESAEPFDANMVMTRAIYRAAQRAGVNVVLDGVGGDLALSSDFHLAFLLRAGRVRQAIGEARGERRFWGPDISVWRSLPAATWQAFAPTPLRAMRFWRGRRASDLLFRARAIAEAPTLDLARALDRRRHVQQRDFEQDRVDALTRVRPLTHPNLVVGRERYDRVAAACGIEPRDPFLDLRLIRFCLSLPRDQLQRGGWPKWILRRAMEGSVPPGVAWRCGKEHVGPDFIRAILEKSGQIGTYQAQVPEQSILNTHYNDIFLSNWFAYMLRFGWVSGPVTREGVDDDDQ